MKVEHITLRQMKAEIKSQIDSREFKLLRIINILSRRISQLEEELFARKTKGGGLKIK